MLPSLAQHENPRMISGILPFPGLFKANASNTFYIRLLDPVLTFYTLLSDTMGHQRLALYA